MHSKGIIVNDREELDENNNSIDIDSPLDDRMKAVCRKRLAGIFHNNDGRFDSYEAIKYCWALKNHGGSFFWKMFNKDEISNAVYEI